MSKHIKTFALTAGDPASIATYLTLKTWVDLKDNNRFCFYVIADASFLKKAVDFYNLNVKIAKIDSPNQAQHVFKTHLPVFDIKLPQEVSIGVENYLNVPFIINSINYAVKHCLAGNAHGVVTNPFNKSVMKKSGFSFDGHTEYLASLLNTNSFNMMLTDDNLKIKTIPIFIHKSLRHVIENLNKEMLFNNIVAINKNFEKTFGFKPKIALSGLNPHAGENGNMGLEEIEIINPCCCLLRQHNVNVSNALPPDTLFIEDTFKNYDLIVTIYHDQALAPFKALCFENGVNATIGLPIIRTSPDHGTAYQIALTKDLISNSSLISALKVAYKLSV